MYRQIEMLLGANMMKSIYITVISIYVKLGLRACDSVGNLEFTDSS